MDKNKIWLIGSVLAMVLILALGGLLVVQPQLAAAAVADVDKTAVEASNAGQAAVLDQLRQDFAGIDVLRAELAPLNESVPSGTEMPAFVNQLDALASASQVTLTEISVADAVPYAPVVAPVAAAPTAESGATTSASPSPSPTPSAVAIAPTAGVPPVTSAEITAANFASLEVTVKVSGSYGNALNFVDGLQTGKRLFLVTGYSTAAVTGADGQTSTDVAATVTGLVYVLVPPTPAVPEPVPAPAT